ncbi:MAG: hypothetical protein R3B06_11905 [Kofleriaceae bacterium]
MEMALLAPTGALAVVANELTWLAVEGDARAATPTSLVSRELLGLTGRLAVGIDPLTDASMVEAGVGLAWATDLEFQAGDYASPKTGGAFNAIFILATATHTRSPDGEDATWLGAQVGFDVGRFEQGPASGKRLVRAQRYGAAAPDAPTDCASGHLP